MFSRILRYGAVVALAAMASPALAQYLPPLPPSTVVGNPTGSLGGTASAIAMPQLRSMLGDFAFAPSVPNSIKGNIAPNPGVAVDLPMPLLSCNGASSALTWTATVGFGCNLVGSNAFLSNTRLAKATAYVAVQADCSDTIALGGIAFFKLSLQAASNYYPNCAFMVVNEDTGRGKTLSIVGYSDFILWPGQTAIVYNQNNAWQIIRPARWTLTGARTMYIDVTLGDDANDGLASGTAALKTFAQAYRNAARLFDLSGQTLTYNVADGTYSAGINSQEGLLGCTYLCLIFSGNAGAPANVLVSTSGSAFKWFQTGNAMSVAVKNMKVTTSSGGDTGDCFFVSSNFVYVAGFNLIIGPCAGVGIRSYNNAEMDMLSNFTINGAMSAGAFCFTNAGAICAWQGLTVTLTNTPSWSTGFAYANGGQILIQSNTWSGSATGPRFNAVNLGLIDTGAGSTGCNALPGNSAGATSTGGICN